MDDPLRKARVVNKEKICYLRRRQPGFFDQYMVKPVCFESELIPLTHQKR
jgi:hypothetical protein